MKIALLGNGKTGHHFKELASFEINVFNSKTPLNIETLKGHDLIVSFLPGDVFKDYMSLLFETGIPVICGSTGFEYEEDFKLKLKKEKRIWIQANNFSLGMNIIKSMLETLSKLQLPAGFEIELKEIHHTHKKDAPSGTALKWKEWLGLKTQIISERIGDVVGFHQVKLKGASEEITLSHDATSRALFARGAIWACQNFNSFNLEPGLHQFDKIVESYLLRGQNA